MFVKPPHWKDANQANPEKRFLKAFKIPVLLMQRLPGSAMANLDDDHSACCAWQETVDKTVEIVHILHEHNTLNTDVSLDSFMVVPPGQAEFEQQQQLDNAIPDGTADTSSITKSEHRSS